MHGVGKGYIVGETFGSRECKRKTIREKEDDEDRDEEEEEEEEKDEEDKDNDNSDDNESPDVDQQCIHFELLGKLSSFNRNSELPALIPAAAWAAS